MPSPRESSFSGVSTDIRDRVAAIFSRWEEVECVYLFGDNGKQAGFPLNFGIFLKRTLLPSEIEKMRASLMNDLEGILERVVDCVVLQEVHPLFMEEILKKGERIYGSLSPHWRGNIPDFEKGVRHER